MTTEAQALRTMTAWEELLDSLEESGDAGLQVVRDLHVLWMVGGADVHVNLFHDLHERAEGARQTLRGREVK